MNNESGRLTIVHTESSGGWGGQELRILTEAQGMIDRGHRVTLLCPPDTRLHTEAQRRGLPTVALAIGRKRLRGILEVRRWLNDNRPDVVNTHSSTDSWLVALASIGLAHAPAIVRTRHISAPVPTNRPTRWLYQSATTRIVTTGERIRRTLIETNGYDAATIVSVPTGVDTARFVPGDRAAARTTLGLLDADYFYIGVVATLRSWKGHRYLIDALAALPAHVRLVVVGDGPQRVDLEQQVRTLRLSNRVTFAGNRDDVQVWLQAFDVFVLPSYANEGVPQSIVQAMLCGLPVVSTRIGSIDEAVLHEETGLLIEPRNSGEIASAVGRLLADAPLRRRLGERGRVVAQTQFGKDSMLDKMEAVFNAALSVSKTR
jgi:glycosyltransferase involved in cell wall biosynthesis